jgi:alkanesulfonate monooxygenase SsuD/methylene tetrahydromethanopterin reductase-like flavin-dependent oxidoreductase (luciferase family)
MANHGTDPGQRFGVMRERVEAIKEIWIHDEASYAGKHVNFERICCWPKPVQVPHPPVLVGGNGPRVIDRVVSYGDAWIPNRIGDDATMIEGFDRLATLSREAGREPIPITVAGMMRDPERIERFERAGVDRAVFWLPLAGRDEIEAAFDRYTAAADAYASAGG